MSTVRGVPLPSRLRLLSRLLRALPASFPGKIRIAQKALSDTPGTVTDQFGHRIAVPSMREPISQQLFANGRYEPEVGALIDRLGPGQTLVDVGANVGIFTLHGARRVGPAGRVLAIEASPLVAAYLHHNVAANRADAVAIESLALSDAEGVASLHIPAADQFGMASLLPRFNTPPVNVPQSTLSQLAARHGIAEIDLLKVDVEGAELLVFKGAADLLQARRIRTIVFEFVDWAEQGRPGVHAGAAQEFLRAAGYHIYQLGDFLQNKAPAREIVRTGAAMLVAVPS